MTVEVGDVPVVDEAELKPDTLTPINEKSDGSVYEFTHGRVFVDALVDNLGDITEQGQDACVVRVASDDSTETAVRYQYGEKVPVILTRSGVRAHADAPKKEAKRQAYFALSIAESKGYVAGFSRK